MAKVKYGNNNLVVALEDYREEMEDWVKKGIAKTTQMIYNTAVALAPVDTGFLKESIDFMYKDGGFTGVVSVGSEYAIFIEYGTGIYSVNSRAKKIPWSYQDADGEWHTTYGMPAQPFWNPAIDAGRKTFSKYFS